MSWCIFKLPPVQNLDMSGSMKEKIIKNSNLALASISLTKELKLCRAVSMFSKQANKILKPSLT